MGFNEDDFNNNKNFELSQRGFVQSHRKNVKGVYCFTPFADMFESSEIIAIHVELAGVKKEDINIELNDGYIEITGIRIRERLSKEENFQRMERLYGLFKRSFSLPKHINKENIEASFKDGVLEIIIPKDKNSISKVIRIDI